ncbi:hypothetical protein T439DRAFT_288911 [Meredithblackwellia eburnea MCA 4105]
MPLLRRRPVPLIQTPDLHKLPNDHPVFFLKATGEIFLEYEAYANRLSYLLNRIFQCEFSGKTNLDYFSALESERQESRVVRERFPDELKGRVLRSLQFQVIGRLDGLVDAVYDRYKDRYFKGEKVFVDLSGDKYYARISNIFPPPTIRDLARQAAESESQQHQHQSANPSSPPPAPTPAPVDYATLAHKLGVDLEVPNDQARRDDDVDEYLYTVQLMDEEHKFEGSFMEVKGKQLSRDRLSFSKSILKRYIRECVQRDAAIASPWTVKPSIAAQFGIPQAQDPDVVERNREIREGKLAKRRKRRPPAEPKKAIKYPIEDLDLDPMSIHDGRVLRRLNAELPPLPAKPRPRRDLLVPPRLFDAFIGVWNLLNIFSIPLTLTNFSLDDFAAALNHSTTEPRCLLLAEIHGCLTNVIGADASRVLGATGVAPLPWMGEQGEGGAEAGLDAEDEFDALIRRGISHSKRWDRTAKLKSAEGKEGWERHMIGCLCQRGGPLSMPNLPKILRHLFAGAELKLPSGTLVVGGSESATMERPTDRANPEKAYLSLDLEDKLSILEYLCTLVLGSKLIRNYIDECELQLTEYRKQRADVNKERKALAELKIAMEGKAATPSLPQQPPPPPAAPAPSLPPLPPSAPSVTNGTNGHGAHGSEAPEDEEEDQLAEDDELDEVMSEGGASLAASDHGGGLTSRRSVLEGKRLERQMQEASRIAELARLKMEAKIKTATRKEAERAKMELEDNIAKNVKKDDYVERQFRRYQSVTRSRPLGKDRFFNRYWWFDGIGGMNLIGQGNGILYGTGRLFIQGPTQEDWDFVCEVNGGEEKMIERRAHEDVDPLATLAVNEWGYFDDEEEYETLQGWLNAKGTRELALKNALIKWRTYIFGGAKKRIADTAAPMKPIDTGGRRSSRSKLDAQPVPSYLHYVNKLSKM